MTNLMPFQTGEMGPTGGAITSGASGASGGGAPLPNYHDLQNGEIHWAPSTTFTADGPTPIKFNTSEFEIGNTHTDGTQGYSIALFSSNGSFAYDEGSGSPTQTSDGAGVITKIEVFDASHTINEEGVDVGKPYFTLDLSSSNVTLYDFWTTLHNSGPKAALDQLIGDSAYITGSGITDYVETYGQFGTYDMEAGSSFLAISYDFTTAYADSGTDTFTILASGFANVSLHGDGPPGEGVVGDQPATINFAAAGTLSFRQSAQIDGFSNVHFVFSAASGGQFIYVTTNNLPAVFDVRGSSSGDPNEIVILPQGDVATTLNLSSVTVADFSRLDQAFVFDFTGNTQNNHLFGVRGARNVFEVGSGNNTVHGGRQADIFEAGPGHDLFYGGGGVDMAIFDGASTHFKIHKVPGTHRWIVHDNRAGSPDGTVTLVNVDYLSFTNHPPIFIGGSTSAATVNHIAHQLASATHADFDLHV